MNIETELRDLAANMQSVATVMLADDQSTTMQDKGAELLGAAATIQQWLGQIEAERTIQKLTRKREAKQ